METVDSRPLPTGGAQEGAPGAAALPGHRWAPERADVHQNPIHAAGRGRAAASAYPLVCRSPAKSGKRRAG